MASRSLSSGEPSATSAAGSTTFRCLSARCARCTADEQGVSVADRYELRLPAIEIVQGTRRIYSFAVDGKVIHDFAAVSRVHRDDEALQGYQRPEVLSHIRAIRRYLESDGAMLPNAIVFAFDERVTFVRAGQDLGFAAVGELVIPVDEALGEDERPALIVDGQQRSAAIRDA